jgi:3-methyladenine DNA glycosylase AlkD
MAFPSRIVVDQEGDRMPTVGRTLRELKALGRPGTARIYARHGVSDPALGVSYASLGKLVRGLGTDHELALELWETGVHEARVLATRIADPERLTRARATRWLKDASDYVVTDAVSGLAARAPDAPAWAERWTRSRHEWTSAAGWNVIAVLVMDGRLSAATARSCLVRIRREIAGAPNRTRFSMNGALISIGGSLPELTGRALQAARAIGPVEIEHGQTGCKTPDAVGYIPRMVERRRGRKTRIRAARSHARGGPAPRKAARKK